MRFTTREISLVGMFVAFAVIAAMVSRFWGSIVPFSLMPFVSIFAGIILGKRLGATAISVYILIGLLGIPVFASVPYGGIAYILNPTFGFLLGFIIAAYVSGWLTEKKETLYRYVTAAIVGLVPLYFVGIIYLWVILNLYLGKNVDWIGVLKIGFFPFIIKDIAVVLFASFLAIGITRRLPYGMLKKIEQ